MLGRLCWQARRRLSHAVKPAPQASASPWEAIVGLEVHTQIIARTKLFSDAPIASLGPVCAAPNSRVTLVDAALPGTLPVINKECVAQAMRTGLSLGGTVQQRSYFQRKHYFYCDMPQGYQITQQNAPIITGGQLSLDEYLPKGQTRTVALARIQLEQDSGKNVHDFHATRTYVDLNRAGVALLEIVSQPDMRSSAEAAAFLQKLQSLLTHIQSCSTNMSEGALRCDVNVSVRRRGESSFGQRVEIKNLNSISALVRAIDHEVTRQVKCLEAGGRIERETRGFNAATGVTVKLRSKEELLDYRFFPEPDLPQLVIPDEFLHTVREQLPELPNDVKHRLVHAYGLSEYDAGVLLSQPWAYYFFESVVLDETISGRRKADVEKVFADVLAAVKSSSGAAAAASGTGKGAGRVVRSPKLVASWIVNDLFGQLRERLLKSHVSGAGLLQEAFVMECPLSQAQMASLVDMLQSGHISGKVGKQVLEILLDAATAAGRAAGEPMRPTELCPRALVKERDWHQVSDPAQITAWCQAVIQEHAKEVADYIKNPKPRAAAFFAGQVIAKSKGRCNPKLADELMKAELAKLTAAPSS